MTFILKQLKLTESKSLGGHQMRTAGAACAANRDRDQSLVFGQQTDDAVALADRHFANNKTSDLYMSHSWASVSVWLHSRDRAGFPDGCANPRAL